MRVSSALRGRLGTTLLLLLLAGAPAAAETLLVVPFENTARLANLEWVGESFAETLTQRLAGPGRIVVSRDERLAALERLGLPATGPLSRASLLRLGEEVEADWVLLGYFQVEDGQLRAKAQWLDIRSLELSPRIEEAGSFAQLIPLQARLAWKLLRQLQPDFSLSLREFEQQFPSRRVSAFESYVRGLLAMNAEQQKRYFLQAARLEPGYPAPAFRLGQLFFEDRDYPTAARWFAKVAAESELALDARFYLALCHYFARDFDRSVKSLAPLAERLPVKQVWNNLGIFASRRGDPKAADYLARAVAADPADADVHFNLGLHYLRREEWEEAAGALERAVELNPGDTEAYFLLAQALERLGRAAEAQQARQRAVGDNPALGLSLERRRLEMDRLDQHFSAHQARFDLEHPAAPAQPSPRAAHVAVHIERGQDFLARELLDPAQHEFTEAILLDPNSYPAHLSLAEIYQRQGRVEAAISELKAALWIEDTVPARLRLAELYLSRDRLAEARAQVRAARLLDPDDAAARALEAKLPAQAATTRAQENEVK